LKKDIIDHLVVLFGDPFNKIGVISLASTYLKYVKDEYKVHLQTNPSYECPPMILKSELNNLLEDANEKKMIK